MPRLAGDIVEACRDMGGAARGRGKPTSLHQGARRRVEVVVARGTGDRKRAHRAGWPDGETHNHYSRRAASARCGGIEEATADGGAHFPNIGRKRGSARRRARGCACRGTSAGSLSGSRPRLRLSRSSRGLLPLRSRLGSRRFDTRRRRWLGPRGRHRRRGRRRWRRRRKLDRSRRRRRCLRCRRRLLLYRRRRLLSDWRRRGFRRRKRGLLDRRRLLLDDRRRRSLRRGGRRLLHDRWRRLLRDWRCHRGWRRRLGRSRGGVLSWRRRGLVGRLRLFRRGRRCFGGRSFRLDVDDYFPGQFDRPGLQVDQRKRGGVKRDHDGDHKRAKPGRAERRRLEDPTVQSGEGHGACALGAVGTGTPGAAGLGAFGAAGAGGAMRAGPDTMAIRVTPFAASSSITDTTSP
jgi:hypothetical protein